MIFGIGNDLVDIQRIEKLLVQYEDRFAQRILSAFEFHQYLAKKKNTIIKIHKLSAFLAKRFAAKEAFVKALGTGFTREVTLQDISVTHNQLGKPELSLSSSLKALCIEQNITQSYLSLSDEKHYALATVVLWQEIIKMV